MDLGVILKSWFSEDDTFCLLTEVVAIERALADSMADPFVSAYSIISITAGSLSLAD